METHGKRNKSRGSLCRAKRLMLRRERVQVKRGQKQNTSEFRDTGKVGDGSENWLI